METLLSAKCWRFGLPCSVVLQKNGRAIFQRPAGIRGLAAVAFSCIFAAGFSPAAHIMQTFFVPFPENDMITSLQTIDAYQGNIGTVVRSTVSIVAGNNGTVIYYDHWEDGYEGDITAPTQSTTQVWGDGNPVNGIPPGYASDVVNAGSIVNLETSMDVTRTSVQIEYDGRDKVG